MGNKVLPPIRGSYPRPRRWRPLNGQIVEGAVHKSHWARFDHLWEYSNIIGYLKCHSNMDDHHIGNANTSPLSSMWFWIVTFAAFSASFTWISAKAISRCLVSQLLHFSKSENTTMTMILMILSNDDEDYLRTEPELVCPLQNRRWPGAWKRSPMRWDKEVGLTFTSRWSNPPKRLALCELLRDIEGGGTWGGTLDARWVAETALQVLQIQLQI